MSDLPRVGLVTRQEIVLTADLIAKIEECVRDYLESNLTEVVRECLSKDDIEKIIEGKVRQVLISEEPKYDLNLIKEKLKRGVELTRSERVFLQGHVLISLSERLKKVGIGKYVAISLEGEILAHSDSRLDLLEKIDKIDYPADRIFLHRIGKEPFMGRI